MSCQKDAECNLFRALFGFVFYQNLKIGALIEENLRNLILMEENLKNIVFHVRKIGKFGTLIEESTLPMSKLKQTVGVNESRWDYSTHFILWIKVP